MATKNNKSLLLVCIITPLILGCSGIIQKARLDRFSAKLESNEIQISEKLNEDLEKRTSNLNRLKKDIDMLEENITDMRKNYHKYLKDSFKRHSKTVKYESMVQLLSHEVTMLEKLQAKEEKLRNILHRLEMLGSAEDEKTIKSLKKEQSTLKDSMDAVYIDIAWFESSGRVNLSNAQQSTSLINESLILSRKGNFTEAINKVNLAKELTPEIPIIYAQLGSLYFLTSDDKTALENYQKAEKLDPSIQGITEMISALESRVNTSP